MEIGSDGSLCRITSSATQHNNAMVIVSESELDKSKGPSYKILIIGTIQNPCESSSEAESDEEIDEKVPKIIESNTGNEGKANTGSDIKNGVNKPKGKESPKSRRRRNRYRDKGFKNRRPNNRYKFHNRHNSSNKRNSYPQNGSTKIYSNTPSSSTSNIEPWMNPNQVMLPSYQFPVYPQFSVTSPIEPHVPKQLNCESSAKSVGLLGNSPYEHFSPQFPPPTQNVPDQNYWNNQTAMHDQNYWNNSHSNNYQRPVPTDRPVSEPKNFQHRKHFPENSWHWRNNRWSKTKDPKNRGIADHYNYDH